METATDILMGLVSLLILSLITCYIYWKTSNRQRQIDLVPGYKNWPLVGDMLHLPWDPADFLTRLLKLVNENRSKLVFKIKVWEKPEMFLFSSVEVANLIADNRPIRKTEALCPLHSYLGNGIFTSTGKEWYSRRETVQPYYDYDILKDQVKTITEHVSLLADRLEGFCGQMFDIFEPITSSTMDTICSTALGLDTGVLKGEPTRYAKALLVIRKAADTNPLTAVLPLHDLRAFTISGWRHNRAVQYAHDEECEIIRKRRTLKDEDKHYLTGRRRLYLDMLLSCLIPDPERETWSAWYRYMVGETRKPLTVEQILEEIDTFIIKGIDPISSAIAFTLHLLATHQDAQKRCHDDLDKVVGCEPELNGSHLHKMVYLEWCIMESLRLFPPIPFFGRKLLHEEQFGKYTIPEGTNINVFIMALHRDPKAFSNPDQFDPTRFDFKKTANRDRHAFLPFSAARRNCFGEKYAMTHLKLVVANLLWRFHIETDQTREELRIRATLTLKPGKDGVRVKLTPRKATRR